jgi:hypothetical protein
LPHHDKAAATHYALSEPFHEQEGRTIRNHHAFVLLCCAIALLVAPARGGVISSRSQLNSLLTSSQTEGFETFPAQFNSVYAFIGDVDASTVIFGQGPGLVRSDVRFRASPNSNLQWNGPSAFSNPTRTILSNATGHGLAIDFLSPVDTFGLDMDTNQPTISIVQCQVLNLSRTAVIATITGVGVSAAGGFVGYQDAGGIGGVIVAQSPAAPDFLCFDNVTYGLALPEPASLSTAAMCATALLCRRQRRMEASSSARSRSWC